MAKGAYIGVEDTYTVLDYIQSSGTQYIDTGVQLTASELAQVKFTVETAFLSNSPAIHGEGNTFVGFYNSGYPFTACIAGSSSQNTTYAYDTAWHTMVLDAVSKKASIDGASHTVNVGTRDMVATFQLFGWSYSDGHHPNSSRIRSARLELGGVALRDYVPCKRGSDGAYGLYDKVNGVFYGNKGTGVFTAGTETGETISRCVARKVKKGYVGVDGKARKIRKAYIGVGGVARPCWSGGEIAYYGQISPISAGRMGVEAASSGKMLFAAGGATGFTVGATHYATVDAYSNQLVHSTAPNRAVSGYRMGAVSVNRKYALFAGGYNAAARASYSQVDAYNDAMTKTAATALSYAADRICGISMGARGVFFGGVGGNHTSESPTNLTNIYTETLTRSVGTTLTTAGAHRGGHAGGYAVVSPEGGTIDAFNETMVKTTLGTVSALTKAADSGSGVVFADQSLAFAFTETLTRVNVETLAGNRHYPSTACLDGIGIFAGGVTARGSATRVASVDGYKELTRMALPALQTARIDHFGGVVGDFALFGGGGTLTSTEAYTIV